MFRSSRIAFQPVILAVAVVLAAAAVAQPQERRTKIRVEHYSIDAEIQPATQALIATAEVRFVPLDNNANSATFELTNALTVSTVGDSKGAAINDTRNSQDFTVKLAFEQPLAKGQPVTAKFAYEGRL